jgi:hypothetical protein
VQAVQTVQTVSEVDELRPNPEDTNRESLKLLDESFELLRQDDVEKAILMLRRAAQIEPNNRLINANLRRLEQLTTTPDRARRRG